MKKILFLFAAFGLLAACSKSDTGPKWNDKLGSCLQNFDYQYEKLLTKADIGKHIDIDEATYKLEVSAMKGQYGNATYSWNSDRPDVEMELLGHTIMTPDKNRAELTQLHFYNAKELELYSQQSVIDLFDIEYRKLSDAEVKEMRENLEREYAGDPAGLEQAHKFLDARLDFDYKRVEQLGDRAYWTWGDYGLELNVLAGTASFSLRTKFSADAETTLSITVALAKEILAKCN
ncbi:hypothetical protein [Parapedobacter soli]|uniref:hypothetical protein n=1 Tax=Parapedobacter soli TaxID=416955 RepID=UPI0021CA375F|nr:hypothetical protein [Parapedobacter soli]